MSFLFSAVITALFFLGRSIGLSPTSTMTTSHCKLVDVSAFLPGKLNCPDLISLSSTRWTILQTVDSWTPHDLEIWKYVRYSRQYSKAINNWSSIVSLGYPPRCLGFGSSFLKTFTIVLNNFGFTPHRRLNSCSLRVLICS